MSGMTPDQGHRPKKRPEPRLVFALVMIAGIVLYGIAQVILVRPGDACEESPQGGLAQLFVPGIGCEQTPPPTAPPATD